MDLTEIDLTDLPGVAVGDEVILWGRSGDGIISVNDVARIAQTISYEMLCTVGRRVSRVYRGLAEKQPARMNMATDKVIIKRALLGVSDKAGLVDFARALQRHGVEIISTGGTKAALEKGGVRGQGGRRIHRLSRDARRTREDAASKNPRRQSSRDAPTPSHQAQMRQHGIEPIDLVVVNFYPFEQTVAKPDVSLEDAIENIDIGGPTLVRAAAKNHGDVAVVVDPSDYAAIAQELEANNGATNRRRLDGAWRARHSLA